MAKHGPEGSGSGQEARNPLHQRRMELLSVKSTAEAVTKVKECSSVFGRPYRIKCDSGLDFRQILEQEMKALGIRVRYSSGYNPSSNGLVKRSNRSLKEVLNKCCNVNAIQLRELIFCVNARDNGSAFSKFLGQGTRSYIPNSMDLKLNLRWEKKYWCKTLGLRMAPGR